MRKRITLVLAVLASLLLIGGVAVASIPDSSGVIHGCRKTSDGSVRVIDTAVTMNCPAGFVPMNWNQIGPTGPQGPAGPAVVVDRVVVSAFVNGGAPVPPGEVGNSAVCPTDYYATGGGYEFSNATTPTLGFRANVNGPAVGWGPEGTAWQAGGISDVSGSFRVWAMCLRTG